MTKRTLRYHHKCPGEVVKRESVPVQKRVKKNQPNKIKMLKNKSLFPHTMRGCKKHWNKETKP
jgi:hypothetical protein